MAFTPSGGGKSSLLAERVFQAIDSKQQHHPFLDPTNLVNQANKGL
jgi:hypothetical protein